MIPLVAIVGRSDSGKTVLLAQLVAELKQRGHKIAVIKHASKDFDMDQEGKDSWRLTKAGADLVSVSSPEKLFSIRSMNREVDPEEIRRFVGSDFDLILTEGFHASKAPKIEVHRGESGHGLLCDPEQLLAVVSDDVLDVKVPRYSKDDVGRLADFIEHRFLSEQGEEVTLFVNGRLIALSPSVEEILSRTLKDMVSVLDDVGDVDKLDIWLNSRVED